MADERTVAEMNFAVVCSCIPRLLRMKRRRRINAEIYLPGTGVPVTNLTGSEFSWVSGPGMIHGRMGPRCTRRVWWPVLTIETPPLPSRKSLDILPTTRRIVATETVEPRVPCRHPQAMYVKAGQHFEVRP